MDNSNLVRGDANDLQKKRRLVSGESVAVTIRMPSTLKQAASEAAQLQGMSFAAFIRASMIEKLLG